MRLSIISLLLFSKTILLAQVTYEVRDYAGVVAAIESGRSFSYSRLFLNVDGREEPFGFNPIYGRLLFEKVKVGSRVTVKASINAKGREMYHTASPDLKGFIRNFIQDVIIEVTVGNEIYKLKPLESDFYERVEKERPRIFIDKKVLTFYSEGDFRKGILLQNGLVAFNKEIDSYYNPFANMEVGDSVSFVGFRLAGFEGGKYPIDGVKEVYTLGLLNRFTGRLKSFLFKQNEVCIGVKFSTPSGNEIKLSFPSDKAEKVKKFLKPDSDLKIYHGRVYDLSKLDLPELQAVIQGKDTLYIDEFGFFGGADVEHEHKPVELSGKITRINKTGRGSIVSIIVAGKYYFEPDPSIAEQIGRLLQRGKEVIIQGKERIKKEGEIYKKEYTIVVPKKIVIDGKTFFSNQP
jgi:hypothetical protein